MSGGDVMTARVLPFALPFLLPFLPLAAACGEQIYDEEAHADLIEALGGTSFTIYPVVLTTEHETYDHEVGAPLATFFLEHELATVVVDETEVPLDTSWQSNQAAMWMETMDHLITYFDDHAFETDYALQVECLFLGGTGDLGGGHAYIVDSELRAAGGFLTNSHSDEWEVHQPTDAEGCVAVVVDALYEQLVEMD